MTMTPEAKGQLSKTIRSLRTRLLEDFKSANDSTYKYSIRRIDQARLSEANATRRRRIEAWTAEQVRGEAGKKNKRTAEDFRRDLEKQAAYTLLNRLLILRLMEAGGLHNGDLVAKGWQSDVFGNLRYFSAEIVENDDTEGLSFWLRMVFDDLAIDMPGLYGDAGMSEYIPIRTQTLRAVIDAFAGAELESCWTDDMTLGWVYQYWNDPEREKLDKKINDGGKIEPYEIASKTQMFTERYMVDWLLQNSLGPMWLAMCQKHAWTPLAESTGTLAALENRRLDWRSRRDAGEVELTDLMPLETELEHRWAYYVPQQIPGDAVEHAPESVRELKILDPAVGSGHFLIVAFDLLYALYEEEASHRGESGDQQKWSSRAIVESILENNLHGIDLDPRAVQIAAAALWIKAKSKCAGAHPSRLNLVASNLGIAQLPEKDPALVELRDTVEKETGIPAELTNQIIEALRGADHLGSLLKIDKAIDEAIESYSVEIGWEGNAMQLKMFPDGRLEQQNLPFPKERATRDLLAAIETFLDKHSGADELGLRLHGEQLAAGVRFMRIVKEGLYDLVVANPPYQGTSKLAASKYIGQNYSLGKADLFAAFLLRGLELARDDGVSSMLTMRNWMFIKQYSRLRKHLLETCDLCSIGDFDRGAFEDVPDEVVSVAVASFAKRTSTTTSIAVCPTPRNDRTRDNLRTHRKRAATLCQTGKVAFDPVELRSVPEWPLVYWWDRHIHEIYQSHDKLGDVAPVRTGLCTSNNARFLRLHWELSTRSERWSPYVTGAQGMEWFDPCDERCVWSFNGLEMKVLNESLYGSFSRVIQNEDFYFRRGVAYTPIGTRFSARVFRRTAIMGKKGSSVFPVDLASTVCAMNSNFARNVLESLNPGLDFQVGDVNRLPLIEIEHADRILAVLENGFSSHERHRETSVEFQDIGGTSWRACQEWAQSAVDRPDDASLLHYVEQRDMESPTAHVSFAVGVALGRFGTDGEGILDPRNNSLDHALPHGILFLDDSLDENDDRDSLGHMAAAPVHAAWADQGPQLNTRRSLRQWLRLDFFKSVHSDMYEKRPIHWPISSKNKTFVAFINIHRWDANTLRHLLADHLQTGALPRLDGELEDLRNNRGDKDTDARFVKVKAWKEELDEFIAMLNQCSEKGPPPTDQDCPKREVDARYDPDLDDGVMINSAALWPLLEPQWKDPKKWWKQLALANPKGNKDYDWSHLAMRYWPTRVDAKCQEDPSLGVAHGCFWKYHPARAWAWELRLQDEIAPDFRIEEAPYPPHPSPLPEGRGNELDGGDTEHRAAYLRDEPLEAIEAIEKEVHRRRKDAEGKILRELTILEPGLWSAEPEACWEMETRIITKQEFGFRLIAPDEDPARAKLLKATPQKATGRNKLLQNRGGDSGYLVGWQEAIEEA
ncbi:BREX-6 system adenine-specific DNA-methyltransferase PglX [Novipirellula sp.]|uniref:BREX-6 system adenine-specific DNA-methyltransferase PglX n=1 Tax=Novipirellula sp. TaxID=2795430 RepID=UPI003562512C